MIIRHQILTFALLMGLSSNFLAEAEAHILSQKLAEAQPCASLKTEALFTTIGVDRVRNASVRTVSFIIDGDDIQLSTNGALECKTSDSAFRKTWVGADFTAVGFANLQNCDAATAEVRLSHARGELGPLLEAFQRDVESSLTGLARDEIKKICLFVSS